MNDRITLLLTLVSALFLVSGSVYAQTIPVCNDIDPITDFYPFTRTKIIIFEEGGSDLTTRLLIPKGLNVYSASMKLMGIPMSIPGIQIPTDIIVVNDVSGSMDDNCGPDGIAQPGETPCKINDMKEATKGFLDVVLNYTDNDAGLVSYSTRVVSWIGLTSNKALLFSEVDTYVAMNETCIACGIDKGIQLLMNSEKPIKAMILMTDGKANRCTYGVCTPYMAKQQALNRAAQAWLYYNISIYAVAFGEDADTELMQQIADVSNGAYYYAAETDIVRVYNDIANQIVESYPTNPAIDIGVDGIDEWSHPGEFMTMEDFDFTSDLQSLVDCTCPGCTVMGDDCLIDVEVSTDTAGQMFLDWLEITGCVPEEPEPPEPADHVVFYQVFYDTPGEGPDEYDYEWMELYNPTENAIDLSNMRIYDNTGLYWIPEGVVIGPGKYLTFARNETSFFSLYGCYPDVYPFTRPLNNDGDQLRLTNIAGTHDVDFVAWEGYVTGWDDVYANTNRSIVRYPPYIDTDTPADWLSDQEAKPRCVIEPPECYDLDGDGYDAVACGGDDCDDSNYDINPGATEVCDGADNDCDTYIDEGVKNTYYFDSDNDGYGDAGNSYEACWPPEGYVTDNTDCDDTDAQINPGAEEICDEIDNNCDGYIDEGEVCVTYPDNDEDGYDIRTDCNDNNPNVHPGATEVCNGIDDDCDGTTDEGCGGGGGVVITGLCLPSWECSDWSECLDGQQTRTCTDSYHCNTNYNKPAETQDCGQEQPPAFVCVEGSRSCLLDKVIECVENEWKDVEVCAWGCEDGVCSPKPEEVVQEETTTGGAGFITAGSPEFWAIVIAVIVILALLGGIWWMRRKKPVK